MTEYHRFNMLLLSVVALVSTILVSTSLYLEPITGNLTRVGGYSENDYGWNKPQERYAAPLYKVNTEKYKGYDDLLVLGDSFSSGNPYINWVNYFVDGTGLTAQVLHFDHGGVERILASEDFQKTPPRYVVIESIEESVYRRFSSSHCKLGDIEPPVRENDSSLKYQRKYNTTEVRRKTNKSGLNLDTAGSYLVKAIPRAIGVNTTRAIKLKINRNDLFSSKIKDHILITESDVEKEEWPRNSTSVIACNLLDAQMKIEANGYTKVVVMIVPDKLTTYSEVVNDLAYSQLSVISRIARESRLNLIRLDNFLQQEVTKGLVDIYLPDDTHWSSIGYKLASEHLAEHLIKNESAVKKY